MRFLFLTPHTYPDFSGSGLNALNFACFLTEQGFKSIVLTFRRNSKIKEKKKYKNVTIRSIRYFNKNLTSKLLSGPAIVLNYIYYLLKTDVVLIYGGQMYAFQLVILLGKILGKKVVFRSTLMGVDDIQSLLEKRSRIVKYLTLKSIQKIDIYYSLHHRFSQIYSKEIKNSAKILECSPGVNTFLFSPQKIIETDIRQKFQIPNDCFVMLCVGFLLKRKGFEELFKQLSKVDINYKLIVVGEHMFHKNHFLKQYQDESNELKKLGIELLGDKLIFADATFDILPFYQSTNAVLINSHTEGFPNVLLEAMACAKPIICRNLEGIDSKTLRNSFNAFTYNYSQEIPELIERLSCSNKVARRLGDNARNTIEERHSFDIVARALIRKLKN